MPEKTFIRKFRQVLRVLEREIELSLTSDTRCCDITPAQCHTLLETEQKKSASLTDLSASLALDISTLSRTADNLYQSGLITRDIDPENRRKVSIRLTEDGLKKAESINNLCDASFKKIFQLIPAEKHAVVLEGISLLGEALTEKRKSSKNCCEK